MRPHVTQVRAIHSTQFLMRVLCSQLQFIILTHLPLIKKKEILFSSLKLIDFLTPPSLNVLILLSFLQWCRKSEAPLTLHRVAFLLGHCRRLLEREAPARKS